ncbi:MULTISPECIES: PLP-dependent aminotransferase family protein [unclassified Bradyrhizobium]|uniref:aminotransferase-like domain-containing protein n=1 Tax=unclassified Bradyrhizobium TaxID=2631580 RepID=UPI00048CCA24|nr:MULTISPECIES: PLP-dependent aminotransferase family protein [unclassified Bradyrhizobium]QIG97995.1 PLP-dependent aminotransferase family protein [Bradyrhizobium sp. 6(2017)]
MDWIPTVSEWHGPMFLRIVDALAADIASGRLVRGQRLPTHRALATALDIDLTTVTRAYGEARRRGLLDARVGQGTFVSETTARAASDLPAPVNIDLSMNLPPQPVEANLDLRIAQGLATIRSEAGFSAYLGYARPGGTTEERDAGAAWLQPRVPSASVDRIVIYPGSQAIIFNALLALTSPGDIVLTEALTFPGIKAAAARLDVRLVGVAMDNEGARPDALDDACRKHRPKAVYLVPTQQNPTTATMSAIRRKAIADIISKRGCVLIEDDVYGPLEPQVAPIATLIPERTYLAASIAKCIAPALRVAYLVAPDAAAEQRMRASMQATMQMPPSLMVALVTQWLRSGVATEVIRAIRNEAAARQQLAGRFLKGVAYAARPASHHLWIPLSKHFDGTDLLSHLMRNGLAVVGEDAFAVGNAAPRGLRVSLGAARNRAELSQALQVLSNAVRTPVGATQIV